MTSLADAIARRSGEWCTFVRIQGFGRVVQGVAEQFSLCCNSPPEYARANPSWIRDCVTELPRVLTEEVEALGGAKEAGGFEFEIIDRNEQDLDFFLRQFRWESNPDTIMAGSATPGVTTIPTRSSTGVGDIVWIGGEAIQVGSAFGSSLINCTRGVLGTRPQNHRPYDPVRFSFPRPENREATLYLVPIDADGPQDELPIGTFTILNFAFAEDFTGWRFTCASTLLQLKRTIAEASQGQYRVEGVWSVGAIVALELLPVTARFSELRSVWGPSDAPEPRYFLLDGKEIVLAQAAIVVDDLGDIDAPSSQATLNIKKRAAAGTARAVDLTDAHPASDAAAGMVVTPVLTAELEDGYCDFRYSPTGATDRSDGSILQSAHWVDLILCLLTSSRTATDGLELVNGFGGQGNWSFLPVGWGAGIPAEKIDVASFLEVKARTPDWLFVAFTLKEPGKLGEVLNKAFLEPLGAFISTNAIGQLRLVLPRLPVAGDNAPLLDQSNLLRAPRADKRYRTLLRGGSNPDSTIRAIILSTRGPDGQPNKHVVSAATFEAQIGTRDSVFAADEIIEIEVLSIRSDQNGIQTLLEEIAVRRIFRYYRPPLAFDAVADLSAIDRPLGDIQALTHPVIPNLRTGARGWVNGILQTIGRGINLRPGRDEPPGIIFKLLGWGPHIRVGRVAPAIYVAPNDFDGVDTVTLSEVNVFTDVDADAAGLPDNDLEAFREGAVVKLLDENGVQLGTGTETIDSITLPDVFTLSGDFGYASFETNGGIVVLADYLDAEPEEQARYVAGADADNGLIAGTGEPWSYGEL